MQLVSAEKDQVVREYVVKDRDILFLKVNVLGRRELRSPDRTRQVSGKALRPLVDSVHLNCVPGCPRDA
jgi:hypothetical protein